jgi:hypothetical protein
MSVSKIFLWARLESYRRVQMLGLVAVRVLAAIGRHFPGRVVGEGTESHVNTLIGLQ